MPAESNLVEFPPKRWSVREDWQREIDEQRTEVIEARTPYSTTFENIVESLPDVSHWGEALESMTAQLSTTVRALSSPLQLTGIETRLAGIEDRLERLEGGFTAPVTVRVRSLAPEPFELNRDIEVVIQTSGDGFVASFIDANLSMSGDTQAEALANLKMLVVDVFEQLEELGEGKLGPAPKRQLHILRSLLGERVEWEH